MKPKLRRGNRGPIRYEMKMVSYKQTNFQTELGTAIRYEMKACRVNGA